MNARHVRAPTPLRPPGSTKPRRLRGMRRRGSWVRLRLALRGQVGGLHEQRGEGAGLGRGEHPVEDKDEGFALGQRRGGDLVAADDLQQD